MSEGPAIPVSFQLLGQSDDDAFRATHEAEAIDILVLRDLSDELATMFAQVMRYILGA